MAVPKQGIAGARPNNSMFDREHKWLFNGEKYIDKTGYIQTKINPNGIAPENQKLGFLSKDEARRDQMSIDIETEKYRQTIRTEMAFAEKFAARAAASLTEEDKARMAELEARGKERRWTHGPDFLFDLGKEATGGVTPYEMKDARETWYSKQRIKKLDGGQRNCGGVVLSSHAVGDNLIGYSDWSKPEFARQPIIRDSFFRSTGVLRDPTPANI